MTRKPSTITCVGALVAGLAAPAFGAQANQTDATDQLSERQAEEVRALVHDILADAETRSTLLQGGVSAGHDGNNFFIGSTDDRFRLNVGGQIQIRGIYNYRSQNNGQPTERDVWGFEIPRAKVDFWGHIANPRLEYRLSVASDLRDTFVGEQLFLQDAVISYELMDGISLWGGQTKAPFLREELIDSSRQLAVERSLVNQVFTVGRVQGVGVNADVHDMVRISGSLNNGARSGEPSHRQVAPIAKPATTFANAPNSRGFLGSQADFALTGRADVKVAGDWDQANEFTAWIGEPMAVFVGAAGHFEKGRTGTAADNNDFWTWTVDASVQHLGWSAFGAINHLRTDLAQGNHAELWGAVAQGSYNIDDTFEPFLRYEYLDLSGSGMPSGPDGNYINVVTAGVNWYHNQHNAKFTADLVWALDGIPSSMLLNMDPSQLRLLGLQPDATDQDDQIALRFQYQLLF